MKTSELSGNRDGENDEKVNIMHLIDAQGGGAVTHVLTLAKNMSAPRMDVYVTFFIPGPVQKLAQEYGLSVIVMKKYIPIDVTLIWRLYRFLRRYNIHIMHTHTINSNFYGRISAKLAGVSVVTTTHSYMIDELSGLESTSQSAMLFFQLDKLMSSWSDKFIAVSLGIKKRLIGQGIASDKVEFIPHGINIASTNEYIHISELKGELGIRNSSTVVAIVGRLVPVKNHRMFLRAVGKVLKERDRVQFLVVGDGILKEELEGLCRELRIQNNVLFTGWRNDMDAIYKILDILVLCSATESQGLVLLEAMAHGKPVIATDVDEVGKTVIDGISGILIPPDDVDQLAKSMQRLIDEPSLRKRLGESSRVLVEREFSVCSMIERISGVYSNCYSSAN